MGMDIPILVSIEMAMFKRLIDNFDAQTAPSILHASKYMLGAAQLGGRALKWINGAFAAWMHAHVFAATAGMGNLGVSAYLRTSNAAVSAALCEGMAWAFVNDYQQGKMTTNTKAKELIAFWAFNELTALLDGVIQAPAETLQDNAVKALGETLANNMPASSAEFINEAAKFLSNMPVSQAAKGIEIITPVIAEHLIKNDGKISPDFLQDMFKGTVYSLVCGNVLGDIADGEVIKEKSKKLIGIMMHDETINKLLQKSIAEKFAKYGGEIFLNKDTVKIFEDIFKNVTPQITTIAKTMKGTI